MVINALMAKFMGLDMDMDMHMHKHKTKSTNTYAQFLNKEHSAGA